MIICLCRLELLVGLNAVSVAGFVVGDIIIAQIMMDVSPMILNNFFWRTMAKNPCCYFCGIKVHFALGLMVSTLYQNQWDIVSYSMVCNLYLQDRK